MSKEKLSIQDVIDELVQRTDISKRISEDFVKSLFNTIEAQLLNGDSVKIKDFGTFKSQWIEPRKSINIQTGEEFVIDGYYKVSFTPDSLFKDLVNEPFAHLEAVELNDDMDDDDEAEQKEKSSESSSPDLSNVNIPSGEMDDDEDSDALSDDDDDDSLDESSENIDEDISDSNALETVSEIDEDQLPIEDNEPVNVNFDEPIRRLEEQALEIKNILFEIQSLSSAKKTVVDESDDILTYAVTETGIIVEGLNDFHDESEINDITEKLHELEVVEPDVKHLVEAVNDSPEKKTDTSDIKEQTTEASYNAYHDEHEDSTGISEIDKLSVEMLLSALTKLEIAVKDLNQIQDDSKLKEITDKLHEIGVVIPHIEQLIEAVIEQSENAVNEIVDPEKTDETQSEQEQRYTSYHVHHDENDYKVAPTDEDIISDDESTLQSDTIAHDLSSVGTTESVLDNEIEEAKKAVEEEQIPSATKYAFTDHTFETKNQTKSEDEVDALDAYLASSRAEVSKSKIWLWIVITIVVIGGLVAVYLFVPGVNSLFSGNEKTPLTTEIATPTEVETVVPTVTADSIETPDTIVTPAIEEVEEDIFAKPRVYNEFIGKEKIIGGTRLTNLAVKYYGHKDFWVYIFEANKNVLDNPDVLVAGTELNIPKLDPRLIDKNNPQTVIKARELHRLYLK